MGLGRKHTPAYTHGKYPHTPLQLILALLQAQRHLVLPEGGAVSKAAFPNLGESEFPPTLQRALFPGTQVLQGSLSPELSSASLEAFFLSETLRVPPLLSRQLQLHVAHPPSLKAGTRGCPDSLPPGKLAAAHPQRSKGHGQESGREPVPGSDNTFGTQAPERKMSEAGLVHAFSTCRKGGRKSR